MERATQFWWCHLCQSFHRLGLTHNANKKDKKENEGVLVTGNIDDVELIDIAISDSIDTTKGAFALRKAVLF